MCYVAALLPAGSPDVLPTVVSAIALSSMITGLALLLLGTLDLGRLIRFIPYPVVGGLLAGTGWLLVVGAIRLMAHVDVNAATAGGLFTIGVLDRWGPGAAFAIVLTVAYRRWSHPLVLPGMLLGGIVLCHAVFWAAGVSHAEAQARGWLLGNYAPVGAWWAPGILTSPHTHWARPRSAARRPRQPAGPGALNPAGAHTGQSPLPIAHCPLPIAHCPLPIGGRMDGQTTSV